MIESHRSSKPIASTVIPASDRRRPESTLLRRLSNFLVTRRSANCASTWWNGGLRTIGVLPQHDRHPDRDDRQPDADGRFRSSPTQQLPRADLPYPIAPQRVALPPVDRLLDHRQPRDARLRVALPRDACSTTSTGWGRTRSSAAAATTGRSTPTRASTRSTSGRRERGGGGARRRPSWRHARAARRARSTRRRRGHKYFAEYLRDPAQRDPRGYIIPSDQPDFLTATKFVNTLRQDRRDRASRDGAVHRRRQAAIRPARTSSRRRRRSARTCSTCSSRRITRTTSRIRAGRRRRRTTTPAGRSRIQMGVKFDRILDGFDGPFEQIAGIAPRARGQRSRRRGAAGYLLSHTARTTRSSRSTALLKAGEDVYWLKSPMTANGKTYPAGTFYVAAKATTTPMLQKLATDKGLVVRRRVGASGAMTRSSCSRSASRCGISTAARCRRAGRAGCFEQFEFPFDVVFPQTLDAGQSEREVRRARLPGRRRFRRRAVTAAAVAAAASVAQSTRARFRRSSAGGSAA